MDPSGIRVGVQELTRIGMREKEMVEVAELFKRLIIDNEPAEKVRDGVINLRKGFTKIHYCYNDGEEAYKHYKLV
jgi:glycine hydroxymethyltransferase